MSVAALSGPGRWNLAALSQRTVVLGAIATVHVLIVYFLPIGSQDSYSRLHTSITEAEIISMERSPPSPPPSLPVVLQVSRPIDIPPMQIAIEVPVDPLPASQAIDTRDLPKAAPPVAVGTPPPVIDPLPVVRPRPIAGPSGVDRYPNASIKAKESGTVVMKICVAPDGRVDNVELAHSSGFPRLDKAALSIAAQYRFQPATRGGHAIAACAQYNIIFKVT